MHLEENIRKLLKPNEKVLYIATYDRSLFTDDIVLARSPIDDAPLAAYSYVPADVYNKKQMLLTDSYVYNEYRVGNIRDRPTSTETYILTSYDVCGNRTGEVQWSGFYKNESPAGTRPGTTAAQIVDFLVLGTKGIYENTDRVIMDFTLGVRKIYLISKVESH